jgi:hypothetical protein
MFRRSRKAEAASADFCDSCGQVCTLACRAEAQRDRVRTAAFTWSVPIR